MYLLYMDESGTSAVPGNTSHFVLTGLSVPIWHWKDCDRAISAIKGRYRLGDAEIHVAWMLRRYLEQDRVPNFSSLTYDQRFHEVERLRNAELLRLQRSGNPKHYRQTKKNYRKTHDYIHLTHEERKSFITETARSVSGWGYARLFAECIDKIHFDPARSSHSIDSQAFEQVVSRFERYLENINEQGQRSYGLLIHDNNETVAKKHTRLMKAFYQQGTLWTEIRNIIETPLFVDSGLTSLVQVADLCSYSLRRYLENNENELFSHVFNRADRIGDVVVGVRHFTGPSCSCEICEGHRMA